MTWIGLVETRTREYVGGVRRGFALLLGGVAVVALAETSAGTASAEPRSLTGRYSPYEERAIRDAAAELRTELEPLPAGKTIEGVDFVRLDPIDRHDPLPGALDRVHATSRPFVLRHELLVREGDAWDDVVVDESARNLRALPQLSLVLCVPMRAAAPDRVRLVVITKDVWSLYPDFDVEATSGGLELLDLEPKETNVAGLQHTALARFVLRPLSYSLGASYEIPRLAGRWLDLVVDANVVVDRDRGVPEGSYGSAGVTQPLFSSRAEWAWSVGTAFSDQVDRRYVNASLASFDPAMPAAAPIPWAWRERTFTDQARLTRSFGWETKDDFTVGASISYASYRVPGAGGPACTADDPRGFCQFERAAVPVGEDRVGPFLQWHGYTSDFLRTLDVDTLGLQEDYRLGHDLWARVYPVLRALGSTRDLLGAYAAAAYTVPIGGDGLARASVESTVETEATARISDASTSLGLALVSPRSRVLGGRVVVAATALNRWRNYLNAQSFVGGDSVLRGYPTRYFAGKDVLAANVEYRSRPVEVASVELGAAAFYDVADAYDGLDRLTPRQAVGVGLRAVFPQIERIALRLDVGFPIGAGGLAGVAPVSFLFAFHQAFGLPTVGSGRGP